MPTPIARPRPARLTTDTAFLKQQRVDNKLFGDFNELLPFNSSNGVQVNSGSPVYKYDNNNEPLGLDLDVDLKSTWTIDALRYDDDKLLFLLRGLLGFGTLPGATAAGGVDTASHRVLRAVPNQVQVSDATPAAGGYVMVYSGSGPDNGVAARLHGDGTLELVQLTASGDIVLATRMTNVTPMAGNYGKLAIERFSNGTFVVAIGGFSVQLVYRDFIDDLPTWGSGAGYVLNGNGSHVTLLYGTMQTTSESGDWSLDAADVQTGATWLDTTYPTLVTYPGGSYSYDTSGISPSAASAGLAFYLRDLKYGDAAYQVDIHLGNAEKAGYQFLSSASGDDGIRIAVTRTGWTTFEVTAGVATQLATGTWSTPFTDDIVLTATLDTNVLTVRDSQGGQVYDGGAPLSYNHPGTYFGPAQDTTDPAYTEVVYNYYYLDPPDRLYSKKLPHSGIGVEVDQASTSVFFLNTDGTRSDVNTTPTGHGGDVGLQITLSATDAQSVKVQARDHRGILLTDYTVDASAFVGLTDANRYSRSVALLTGNGVAVSVVHYEPTVGGGSGGGTPPPPPPPPPTSFTEDFTRSDRLLVGDNGWVNGDLDGAGDPGTAIQIVSNHAVVAGGSAAANVMHRLAPDDVIDFTIDIFRSSTSGSSTILIGTEPGTNKGFRFTYDSSLGFQFVQTNGVATTVTSTQAPGYSPAFTGSTGNFRFVLTKSTRHLMIYKDGTLFFEGTAAAGTAFGDYVGFGSNVNGADQWDNLHAVNVGLAAPVRVGANRSVIGDYTNASSIYQAFTTGPSPVTLDAVEAYFYNNTSPGTLRLGIASAVGSAVTGVVWVGAAPTPLDNPAQAASAATAVAVRSALAAPITLSASTEYFLVALGASGVGATGIGQDPSGTDVVSGGVASCGTDGYANGGNWSGPLNRSYRFSLFSG